MLILIRYANLILALILMISLIIGFSILIKNIFEARLQKSKGKQKAKVGDLPSDAGVRDLIVQGKIQEAILLYQQFTGVDEFTAIDAVEHLQREVRLSSVQADITTILDTNGKAAAIQAYQEMTGRDFDEGLRFVETIEKANL